MLIVQSKVQTIVGDVWLRNLPKQNKTWAIGPAATYPSLGYVRVVLHIQWANESAPQDIVQIKI
jgi:hypothetical protein